jgi:anti-sigma factor RsiW
MTCREFADFLDQYINGELPTVQAAAFDEHLGLCPDCRHYLDTYRQTIALSRKVLSASANAPASEHIPEELVKAVLQARSRPI